MIVDMKKRRFSVYSYRTLVLCILFLAGVFFALPVVAEDSVVRVHSDIWMPYNGVPGSDEEGYAVDILREIFTPHDIRVEYADRSWNRSVLGLEQGGTDLVIGAFKFEVPNCIFPETTIGETVMGLYSTNPHLKINDYDGLRDLKIGIVSGWGYRKWLLEDAEKHPENYIRLYGDEAFPKLMELLLAHRVQLIPGSSMVMNYQIKRNGLQDKVFFVGYGPSPKSEKLYYAFSPLHPERSRRLAKIVDDGMKRLRESGRLAAILAKYGLSDWE
ncbi:transporter substrate-binding domain-containing protein [Pseudodesulfovibrio sp. zrk46]|uniref:substrate-binding periplasmic protein n=1 Tax=Pseudodesulfovibrio sp. zrk46 TaxID=2725288 RepID=UPI001449B50F|nr:transporter substrate-binding domain-containing protein [Pseudodesulfovibrio sp. zrk46]QJB56422.1 amino acid ABC transporter substrate-binding protein [Pseudodesulfovibrio sp. zrk46]